MRASLLAVALAAATAHAQSGVRTIEYGKKLNDDRVDLTGFVDLHTHPLNHISFGGKVFHGAPDVDIWMPADMRGCDLPAGRAASVDEALSACGPTHKIVARGCGNVWRGIGIWALEDENNAQHAHGKGAAVGEKSWPAYNDITHQQMWVDWIERAYRGGLRVMVALVTNNKMLADGVRGADTDDMAAIRRAIPETIRLVERHPWMAIARSADDVRRIVGEDRMAVILGTEVDDIGGMVAEARAGRPPSDADVRRHIRALHAMGVRYMFPLHVVDNLFGGTAAYRSAFDLANRYLAGFYWSLRCAKGYDFPHKVDALPKLASGLNLKMDISEHSGAPACEAGFGHVNRRGLTRRGAIAIDEMMRLGMFVDVDHMSHEAIDDTIAIARAFHGGYPLVSGHSSLLDANADPDPDGYARREDKKLGRHYAAIRELGGIAGVEWDATSAVVDAPRFVSEVGRVMAYAGTAIAFGTDINGMVVQPKPPATRAVDYSPRFPRSKLGAREWDYNTEGMVHYGLITDFLKDVERTGRRRIAPVLAVAGDTGAPVRDARIDVGGPDVIDALFGGAEAFARTWERAEAKAAAARRAPAERLPPNVVEIPATVIGPLCPTQHEHGREFGGHGPRFRAKVELRLAGSQLIAHVFFDAVQTSGGRTRATQEWDVVVANAPRGTRFEQILGAPSARTGEVSGISSAGGFQFIIVRQPPATMWMTPDAGTAVDEFQIVGDTGGLDISDDADCRDDTSVTASLVPIRVRTAPIAPVTIDAVDVQIATGDDDIRGGPAHIQIDTAAGPSPWIDVTAIGNGKRRTASIRVPLGRTVRTSDLRTLQLRHVSNHCFACTTDHWAVSSLTVTAPGAGTLLSVGAFDIAHTTRSFAFP